MQDIRSWRKVVHKELCRAERIANCVTETGAGVNVVRRSALEFECSCYPCLVGGPDCITKSVLTFRFVLSCVTSLGAAHSRSDVPHGSSRPEDAGVAVQLDGSRHSGVFQRVECRRRENLCAARYRSCSFRYSQRQQRPFAGPPRCQLFDSQAEHVLQFVQGSQRVRLGHASTPHAHVAERWRRKTSRCWERDTSSAHTRPVHDVVVC
jgi:hypothetical protein